MLRDDRPWEEFELAPPPKTVFKRQCQAHDAETGKRCSLLEHASGPHNASGRPFTVALGPDAAPRRELDVWATAQREQLIDGGGALDRSYYQSAQYRRQHRAEQKALKGEKLFTPDQAKADRERVTAARRAKRELRKAQDRLVEQLIAQPIKGLQ